MHGPTSVWPDRHRFAFTIFDDPDSQTLEGGREIYALLGDLGLRTTKGVWPIRGPGVPSDPGVTCDEPGYVPWLNELRAAGFEAGLHNATSHTSPREETLRGLEAFESHFREAPRVLANHYFCEEAIYWGSERLTGLRRHLYDALTLTRNRNRSFGHVEGHPYFWGDYCRERIKYVRNFVFPDINTLKACPVMPYHDPLRPYVNYWYASSEGANVNSFNACLHERHQDRLEEEGGACIMYTHFGHGFYSDGRIDARFRSLMDRLARRDAWFVPVSPLLDHLLAARGEQPITDAQRRNIEWQWLWHKIRRGTS